MYVVFVDILGFADAVDAMSDRDHVAMASIVDEGGAEANNATLHTYIRFGQVLRDVLRHTPGENRRPKGEFIFIFSDSAFVAFERAVEAAYFVVSVIASLYSYRIPARAGIAEGGLVMLPVALTAHHFGATLMNVPFLGSGVVRAYRAENSGKGLRIFVHPSAVSSLREASGHLLLPLPADEVSIHASHELNYCYRYRYPVLINGAFIEPLHEMQRRAPPSAQLHYERTEMALMRMTSAAGA